MLKLPHFYDGLESSLSDSGVCWRVFLMDWMWVKIPLWKWWGSHNLKTTILHQNKGKPPCKSAWSAHLSCEHLDPRRKKIKSQPHQVFSLLTFIKCMLKKNTGLLLLPFKGFTWGKQIIEVLQYHKKHFSNWQNLLSLHTHCALWTFWYPSVGARS